MSGGIYLMRDDGELVEMNERGYDSEALLQGYLARHHDLLAGDQIDGAAPRRWLLVSQEMSLASEEDGSGRWAVDHLFLDQDAVPTIVETKRSSDTRIRREVVGQMLDYAANGVSYWKVDALRERFESNPESEQALFDLLENPDADPDEFWQMVERNLQAGRVRLVFVSDRIPDELRRIVEFLNEQMNPAEVLAVEIKQYVGEGSNLRTLVPRVIGQTTKARDHKSVAARSGGGSWNEETFFKELEAKKPEALAPSREIFEWAEREASRVSWGSGKKYGTFSPIVEHNGTEYKFISVWTDGSGYVWFGDMRTKPPFADEAKRLEFLRRLNEAPGFEMPEKAIDKYPTIRLTNLGGADARAKLLEALDWFVEEVRAT